MRKNIVKTTNRALIITALLTMSQAALADPTSLVCNEKGTAGVYTFDGALIVDLDDTQRTVVLHYPGVTFIQPMGHREANTLGPVPATFSADSITFSIPGNIITISRVTGEAVVRTMAGLTMAESWNCHVATKQF